ncbi:hypothetical protein BofuT4_uP018180.1 [Botrytis cinerea T4]|uniref:Uncharacterized protein n=1 Tax=Botryotinia fuckeliana (strain T4) TaxID=999810 RepID=G2YIH5_BOTF4|nr:hypothetical protein BofuT4_uP018180.1 [Botrytis cinerea T4]
MRFGLSNGPRDFLDTGTCVDQHLRAFYRDGGPLAAISELETIGHALFGDQNRFLSEHYIVGDIQSSTVSNQCWWYLVSCKNEHVLHLFNLVDAE